MDFSVPLWKILDLGIRAAQLAAVNTTHEQLTARLRKDVCSFQREYTKYKTVSATAHKAFKELYQSANTTADARSASKGNYEKLAEVIENGLKSLAGDHANYIQTYFVETHRHKDKPRVAIYAISESGELYDLVVLPARGKEEPKVIGDYSAFQRVVNTGLPYLVNNLPRTIKEDEAFKHPSLNLTAIRGAYKPRILDRKMPARWRNNVLRRSRPDRTWASMLSEPTPEIETFYKSTLVVPITYREHVDRNKIEPHITRTLGIKEGGRAILGFIVVDHPTTFYFDEGPADSYENIDINVMYKYADLLSFAYIIALMYQSGSQTIRKYNDTNQSEAHRL